MYDVAVIGGGPAGAMAAYRLSAGGLRVLLFEQKDWPRVKPCGGAVTTRALHLLPPGWEGLVESRPRTFLLAGRGATAAVTAQDPYCYTVRRVRFDAWLFDMAVGAGAEPHAGEPVTALAESPTGYVVTTPRGTYAARYVIGADGAKGLTARWLGLRTASRGAALEVEGPVPASLYDRYGDACLVEPLDVPWGYAWVIPKASGVLNIGVGSFHPTATPLKAALAQYLARTGVPAGPILAHPLPFRWRPTPLVRGHACLVGDAAGLMDPFSAEGIYHALQSAVWAAEAVLAAAPAGATLAGYDDRLRERFWPDHRHATVMGRLFYPLAGFWTQLFQQDPRLIRLYLEVAEGRRRYGDLVRATEWSLLTYGAGKVRRPGPA